MDQFFPYFMQSFLELFGWQADWLRNTKQFIDDCAWYLFGLFRPDWVRKTKHDKEIITLIRSFSDLASIIACFSVALKEQICGIAAIICAVVGISAIFLLNTDNTSEVFENNQEISKLDIPTTFSEPIKISQSIENAQPSPNVIISDEGKIYVLYQDTVVNEIGTNLYLKTSTDNGKTFSEPVA